ncbi:hypothetical protein [Streptomyces europaeiscabiei]|uniref:hypothetical protein n=1 Tax=Streptomyces europaeiscabiei TaxID=146819 RepID=UPI0029A2346A|nr:hypothetical protein [Streptomyces europaeiscabiei]MDX3860056.1 hypothetical protein [Streptomyces europaeiscabiei]
MKKLMKLLSTSRDKGSKPERPAPGRAPRSVVRAVRTAALVLWVSSAIWTGWSLNHIVKTAAVAVVLTVLLEAAYALATLYFHYGRTTLSRWMLGAALVPVVCVLAYADHGMFGWVGVGFAAGPLVAEGGFLLAAWLSVDPAAPTAADMDELNAVLRGSAHQGALDAAKLTEELRKLDHLAQAEIRGAELEADVTVAKSAAARRARIAAPVTIEIERADDPQDDEPQHRAVAGVSRARDPKELTQGATFGFARVLGAHDGAQGAQDGATCENADPQDGAQDGGHRADRAALATVNAPRKTSRADRIERVRRDRMTVAQIVAEWNVSERTAQDYRKAAGMTAA